MTRNKQFFTRLLITLKIVALISVNQVFSQNCIVNGVLSGWYFWHGKRNSNGSIDYLNPVSVPNSSRIAFYTAAAGGSIFTNSMCTVNLSWVPDGFQSSLRVGNNKDGSQIDRAAYSFLVDSTNALVQMSIAVFLEYDDDHNANVQPKFEIHVRDASGEDIPCGYFKVVAGFNVPGFETQPGGACNTPKPIQYLPWKPVSVDLTSYIGQNITFEFTASDCSEAGHFGFGMVATKCQDAKITTSAFCPGVSDNISLWAPEGFGSYLWSNGATTRNVTIQNPQPGEIYWVKFKPFSNLSGGCESYLEFKIPSANDVLPKAKESFCEGGSVQISASGAPTGSTYHWLPGGQTSAGITVSNPGVYVITANKNGCPLRDTIVIEQIDLPDFDIQTTDVSCAGANNGRADIVTNGVGYEITWENGENSAFIDSLPAGSYAVTVIENVSVLNCSVSTTVEIKEPSPLTSQMSILKLPYCDNGAEGQAAAVINGGTSPYEISWSHGETGQQVEILEDGKYSISVTDSNGCLHFDSIVIPRLQFSLEKKDNNCPKGREGEILINVESGLPPYQFSIFPGGDSNQPIFANLLSGIYEVQVVSLGCQITKFIEIEDLRDDFFQITLLAKDTIKLGESQEINLNYNYPVGEVKYILNPQDSVIYTDDWRLLFIPTKSDEILIIAKDIYGCQDTANFRYTVAKIRDLYIPNAFSPNGLTQNQRFNFSFNESQVEEIELFQVYDRWGALLYEEKNKRHLNGWDGTYNGKVSQPGVYVYGLKVRFIDDEVILYKGDVTLFRQ